MTYITKYNIPDMQHPDHEDKAAQTLRTALMNGCTWLQYCLLMTHIMPYKGKEYPAYYLNKDTKDYAIITPDNRLQSLGFFAINSDPEFNITDEPVKYDMSFICWFNQKSINANVDEDITNGLMNEAIIILKRNGCENIMKTTDFSKIFDYSGISLKEVHMLGNNFKAFKLTFNYYQSECYRKYSENTYI